MCVHLFSSVGSGHHLPACAPPSTCSISPEVKVASVRNKAASTISLTDPANTVQSLEEVMSLRLMHRSVDHSRRDRVYANALLRVFNGERARHCIQRALQHNLNGRPHTCDRLVNQRSGHVDDAARFLPQHLLYGEL